MKKIAVIQTAFPGDVILATPVFEALKDKDPEYHLAAIVRPESHSLLKDNPYLDEIIMFDKYGKDKGVRGLLRVAGRLRNYDWAIIIQRFLRSALIAYLGKVKRRTGFDSSGFRFLYTEKIPYNEDKHEVQRCLELIGITRKEKYRPRIFITDETRKKTDKLLSKYRIPGEFVVVAPGSVWATKRYPRYGRLVDLIKDRFGLKTVLLGGAYDIEISKSIAQLSHNRPFDLTGKTDLLISADIISRSKIVIANDSAPSHIAAAMNTPVVAVFGPTVPSFGFAPYSQNSKVVDIGKLYCRPCTRHGSEKCPEGHFRCMLELAPESIIEGAEVLIS
jgi:heptosyltransferase-2